LDLPKKSAFNEEHELLPEKGVRWRTTGQPRVKELPPYGRTELRRRTYLLTRKALGGNRTKAATASRKLFSLPKGRVSPERARLEVRVDLLEGKRFLALYN